MPIRLSPDDDIFELVRGLQASERLDVERERAIRRCRRLIDRTSCDLQIGGLQRGDDFTGRQAARCHLLRVEPDAHRIIARAEDGDVADAVDARQHVFDVERRVVRNVLLIARSVGRHHVHDHHQIGRGFAYRDAKPAHIFRQPRLGDGDTVLHQHLRLVDVRPRLEDDADRYLPVARRLRVDIEHVVNAVDFLLDRRRDGFCNHLRRGAGISGVNADGRRRYFGIFGDRQEAQRDQSEDRDDHRDDGRKDRPINEEM